MKKKTKTLILSIVVTLILLLTFTITYAAFTYIQTGNDNHQLILGDIYMHYEESNGINLHGALPGDEYSQYFEFTISGKNTYKQKDIYYDFKLARGDVPEGKTEENRIPDKYLKFKLTKVNEDNSETVLFTDKTYNDLTNQTIYVETIAKNTTSQVNNIYRLYMVISENLVLGNTSDAVMTHEQFGNVFASVKVNVTGDFNEKEITEDPTFANLIKTKYGTDTTLVAVNNDGDLYDGTGEIREYRYSGPTANNYVFFDTNGDGNKTDDEVWRVIGVFEDNGEEKVKLVRNTMLTSDVELPENYVIDGINYNIACTSNYCYPIGVHWNKTSSGTFPSTSESDWTKAGLQYYLNTENDESDTPNAGYLSFLSEEARELMSSATYYLGNVERDVSTVKLAYTQERDETRLWPDNRESWNGLVGMLYTSDYGYSASSTYWETDMVGWNSAESDGVVASTTSWLYNEYDEVWSISPSANDSNMALLLSAAGNVGKHGFGISGTIDSLPGVKPVIYLNSNAMGIDAEGTETNPYTIIVE